MLKLPRRPSAHAMWVVVILLGVFICTAWLLQKGQVGANIAGVLSLAAAIVIALAGKGSSEGSSDRSSVVKATGVAVMLCASIWLAWSWYQANRPLDVTGEVNPVHQTLDVNASTPVTDRTEVVIRHAPDGRRNLEIAFGVSNSPGAASSQYCVPSAKVVVGRNSESATLHPGQPTTIELGAHQGEIRLTVTLIAALDCVMDVTVTEAVLSK